MFLFGALLTFLRYLLQTRELSDPHAELSITDLSGKTIIITGGYNSTGIATAIEYIKLNARVIITCLNETQGQLVIEKVKQILLTKHKKNNNKIAELVSKLNSDIIDYIILDTSNIRSICQATIFEQFENKKIKNIDYLILNDEIAAYKESVKYEISKVFITNYLGHFKFVLIVLPIILQTAQQRGYNEDYGAACRVVSVISWMYRLCDNDILSILLNKHERTLYKPQPNVNNNNNNNGMTNKNNKNSNNKSTTININNNTNDTSDNNNNNNYNNNSVRHYTDFELFENRLRRLDKYALLFRKSIENKPNGNNIAFYCDDSDYSQSKLYLIMFMKLLNIKINQSTTMGNKNIVCCSVDTGTLIDNITNNNNNDNTSSSNNGNNDNNNEELQYMGLVSFLNNKRFQSNEAFWIKILQILKIMLKPFEFLYLRKVEIGVENILYATCNKNIKHGKIIVNCQQIDFDKFIWKLSNEYNVLKNDNQVAWQNLWTWSEKLVKFLT